jgi:diacylglycerol kinase (ATP)
VRALAIVNPVAGRGRAARVLSRLREQLPFVHEWHCVSTQHRGHARELAAAAARDGIDRVVAIGGDGVVSEVATALGTTPTALAIIPVGTGNDSARNLGVPADPFAAARLADSGLARSIDLGEVRTAAGTTCFVSVAGFGFDAEVAWRVNRLPKLVGGTLPYVVGVLQTLWRYRSPVMRVRLGDDNPVVDRRVFLVAVANCTSYGGAMRIVPHARPDDGQLDLCVVGNLPRLEVLRLVPKLYSGGHARHRAVTFFATTELAAEADGRVRCQADGELVGELPASFRVLPGALRCVTGHMP